MKHVKNVKIALIVTSYIIHNDRVDSMDFYIGLLSIKSISLNIFFLFLHLMLSLIFIHKKNETGLLKRMMHDFVNFIWKIQYVLVSACTLYNYKANISTTY